MRRWMEAADHYIKGMSVRDMVLVKICVWAWGFMIGIGIPKKYKGKAVLVAAVVFSVTYPIVMIPFLNTIEKKD